MEQPTDVALDERLVRELVAEQFPQLKLEHLQFIGEGEGRTYLVDGAFIFRFPRNEHGAEKMRREICLLSGIGANLPIAVPALELMGQPSDRYPYPFAGHRRIAGGSGEEVRPEQRHWPAIARQLGDFLSVLHAVPLSIGERCGLLRHEMQEPESLLNSTLQYTPFIRKELPDLIEDEMEPYLSGTVTVPPPSLPGAFVCNADIKGEHLIVSEQADAVVGIIDWTDCCISDSLLDFTGLMIWLGETFVRQVLDHYTCAVDEHFTERVCFYARCFALDNLGAWLTTSWSAPIELLKTQARWAFAE